jgi:hypothetical protein
MENDCYFLLLTKPNIRTYRKQVYFSPNPHTNFKAPYALSVKMSDFFTSYLTEKLIKLLSFYRQ